MALTVPNNLSVTDFVGSVPDPRRRADTAAAVAAITAAAGVEPVMWGPSIIGFGRYHYRYASGREGDSMVIGVSPRKAALTLYLAGGKEGSADLLSRLGPHTTGKGCVYLKSWAGLDEEVLAEMVTDVMRRYDGQIIVS